MQKMLSSNKQKILKEVVQTDPNTPVIVHDEEADVFVGILPHVVYDTYCSSYARKEWRDAVNREVKAYSEN